MSPALRLIVVFAVATALVAAIAAGIFFYAMHGIERDVKAALKPAPSQKIHFLAGRDIPDGSWLILYPPAYASDGPAPAQDTPAFRVVRDTALIRRAANKVWYEEDDSNRTGLIVLSVLFLSPPTSSLDRDFAMLMRPDGTRDLFRFYRRNAKGPGGGPVREMGDLVAASQPVFEHHILAESAAQYTEQARKIARDPDLFTFDPVAPPSADFAFPLKSDLTFPSVILPEAEMTPARIAAERAAAIERFTTLLGPPGKAYSPLELTRAQHCGPVQVRDAQGAAVIVAGDPLTLPGIATLTFKARLLSDQAVVDTLRARAGDYPPLQDKTPELDAAFAARLKDKLGADGIEGYSLYIDCYADAFSIWWPQKVTQYLSWYEIVPEDE